MSDDQIEEMVRDLVNNLGDEVRGAALEWLDRRTVCYTAMVELELIETKADAA